MDSKRKPKRPRSATPSSLKSGEGESPPKKKNKKSKKKKKREAAAAAAAAASNAETPTKNLDSILDDDNPTNDHARIMSRMLSTFSAPEEARFGAYGHSRLDPMVIDRWTAACWMHRIDPAAMAKEDKLRRQRSRSSSSAPQLNLERLTATPRHATEIRTVVALAAKTFAQRWVTRALSERKEEGGHESNKRPLQATELWDTWMRGQQQAHPDGAGPTSLFCAIPTMRTWAIGATSQQHDEFEQARLAALEAQALYDEKFAGAANSSETKEQEVDKEDEANLVMDGS